MITVFIRSEITMWTAKTVRILGLASLVLLTGCMSTGRSFKYQNTGSLELGKTLSSDYRAMFGKPSEVEIRDTTTGKYETASYVYVYADLGSARVRGLHLEFRDGVLNAYKYLSSFDKDKTMTYPEQLSQVKRGTSRKEDVINILGTPHGMGKYPSYLFDFTNTSKEGIELWSWHVFDKVSTFGVAYGRVEPRMHTISIAFDFSGIVTDVESVEKTITD